MLRAFGKFQLIRPLGRGAMGEVYLAEDPVIGRRVAIKTIRGVDAETQEARDRFLREARAAGVLNHPNLVTIHEFGEVEGTLYLAMEYVEGEDLQRLFETRALPAPDLLEVLAQVCEGLAYAHGKGVIHRDIKPSNIRVVREGSKLTAKVMDFGIARMHNSDLTGTGTLLGTFGYMAPEYIQTGKPEARSDLFAVGVILYEALAGRRPFEGDTTATILYRVVHEEPAPLDPALLRGLSPRLGEVLRRALSKEPWARFQDGHAMAQALRDAKDPAWGGPLWAGISEAEPTRPAARTAVALAEAPPTTREVPPTEALPRRPQPASARVEARGRGGRLVAVLLLLAAAGGGGAWWATHRPPAQVKTISLSEPPPSAAPSGPAAAPAPKSAPAVPRAEPKAAKLAPKVEPPLTAEEAEAWLNDAAFGVVNTPQESLRLIDRVVKDHPTLPRARALQVAGLYHAGRYAEMPKALQAAKDAGLELRQFAFYGAFQTMLRTERQERRLPADVREALVELFPRAEGRPGGRFTRPFSRGN